MVLAWLKTLIKLHWVQIVKRASKSEMSSLSQIQAFIKRKTQVLPRLMTLHGKIEMAKKTLELKKLHKTKKQQVHAEPLTYIDADEAEDVDMESEDSEEEIE